MAYDGVQMPWDEGRANIQAGRFEAAVAAYHAALDRQPFNWILMNEIAQFLTFTLREPARRRGNGQGGAGSEPVLVGGAVEHVGDAYFELGRIGEAKNAYLRGLQVNPTDVKSRYNLSWILISEANYREALTVIAEAMALDETGEFYERLGKKQAEIMQRLAHRNQQRGLLMDNRVSKKSFEDFQSGNK